MSSTNPIILLLEDCPVTALLVERAVLSELPACRLIWARSVAEAALRSDGVSVSLFLIDVHLPDGSGLEFLERAAVDHPSSCAIVITATPLPEHRVMSAALGALNFLEKPLKIPLLLGQIRCALGSHSASAGDRDFRATLENVTPMDILQLKCLSAASTVIEFKTNSQEGRVRFQKGEIVDARTGSLSGVEAVREIIGWPHGRVTEHVEIGEFERTIHCSWQALLMEVAQGIDEQRAHAAAVA
jgi:DNA-binding response OmpR family regulator